MPGKAAVTIDKRDFDAAIFDLDGVLIDTAGIHTAAWKVVFDAFLNRRADRQGLQFRPFESTSTIRPMLTAGRGSQSHSSIDLDRRELPVTHGKAIGNAERGPP